MAKELPEWFTKPAHGPMYSPKPEKENTEAKKALLEDALEPIEFKADFSVESHYLEREESRVPARVSIDYDEEAKRKLREMEEEIEAEKAEVEKEIEELDFCLQNCFPDYEQ